MLGQPWALLDRRAPSGSDWDLAARVEPRFEASIAKQESSLS